MSDERTVDYSHLGVGQFYFRQRGVSQAYLPLGNAEEVQFGIEQNTIEQPDYRRAGGGMRNQIERITGVTLSFNAYDLSPRNIAAVLYGDKSVTEGATKTELLIAYTGGFLPLAQPDPTDVTVSEYDTGTETVGAVIAEEEYIVEDGGIWINSDAASITDGDTIQVEYTHGEANVIEALMNSGHEYEGSFRGYNEATGKHFSVDVHRFRFSPAEELGLVGEEFAQLQMQARVLSDSGKGSGESAYFRMTQAV